MRLTLHKSCFSVSICAFVLHFLVFTVKHKKKMSKKKNVKKKKKKKQEMSVKMAYTTGAGYLTPNPLASGIEL